MGDNLFTKGDHSNKILHLSSLPQMAKDHSYLLVWLNKKVKCMDGQELFSLNCLAHSGREMDSVYEYVHFSSTGPCIWGSITPVT